jgi:hypothetical protein
MKTLKITLILALILTAFTSCVEQDLNDEETIENRNTGIPTPPTGGQEDGGV